MAGRLYSENRKRLWRVSGDAAGGGCAGIETTLTFGEDNQVSQRLVYIGKKDGIFTDRGTFSADGSIVAVTLSGEEPSYYRLEGGSCAVLIWICSLWKGLWRIIIF